MQLWGEVLSEYARGSSKDLMFSIGLRDKARLHELEFLTTHSKSKPPFLSSGIIVIWPTISVFTALRR
jgi:hypothetical protein